MREEFIQQYYEDVGHYPSEEVIEHYLGEMYYQEPDYRQQTQSSYRKNSNPNDDLLDEIRGIVSDISSSARVAINNRVPDNDQFTEFRYMTFIFAAKTFLYFVFKNSIEDGFDFRNM